MRLKASGCFTPGERNIPYNNWIIVLWFSEWSGRDKKKNGEVRSMFIQGPCYDDGWGNGGIAPDILDLEHQIEMCGLDSMAKKGTPASDGDLTPIFHPYNLQLVLIKKVVYKVGEDFRRAINVFQVSTELLVNRSLNRF
jgi:hypothetical protein